LYCRHVAAPWNAIKESQPILLARIERKLTLRLRV